MLFLDEGNDSQLVAGVLGETSQAMHDVDHWLGNMVAIDGSTGKRTTQMTLL